MGQWTQKCALYMFGLDGVSVSYFHPLNSIEIECQKYSCIWIFFLLLLFFVVGFLFLCCMGVVFGDLWGFFLYYYCFLLLDCSYMQ